MKNFSRFFQKNISVGALILRIFTQTPRWRLEKICKRHRLFTSKDNHIKEQSMAVIRVGISGAAGRMGQRLIVLGTADNALEVAAAIEVENHPKLGDDIGELCGIGKIGVPLSAELDRNVDVLIDFSSPKGTERIVQQCLNRRTPLVFATTGTTPQQDQLLRETATQIPVLASPSMSMTVNLTMKLCELAAKTLKDKDVDVEILERHHRFKADAPSGTALKFGKIIAAEMGQAVEQHGREGRIGERPRNEIGYHAIRIGDNPGEHSILFGLMGETLELTVKASNRDCYALGALAAAKFLHGKRPGLYSMSDVLGL
jgi:4-hydroxy-tetrahydrodipicolinate reductase